MLINEVIDSKAIAAVATDNASNEIPFLGLNWFPERKKMGLDLKWIRTSNGLPVTLKPSRDQPRYSRAYLRLRSLCFHRG